jgi:putative transposase
MNMALETLLKTPPLLKKSEKKVPIYNNLRTHFSLDLRKPAELHLNLNIKYKYK